MEAGRDTRCKSKEGTRNTQKRVGEKKEEEGNPEPSREDEEKFFLLLCLRICLASIKSSNAAMNAALEQKTIVSSR